MIVVSNATPLIILAKAGLFDLLPTLFSEITISEAVWDEVVVCGSGRPGSLETEQATLIRICQLTEPELLTTWQDAYKLGAGEISTILLARQLSAELALVDDRRARRLAARAGIAFSGSIAVLESGYRQKYFSDLRDVYLRLLEGGTRMSRDLLNRSLSDFGLPPL